jgi:hypothetical protein
MHGQDMKTRTLVNTVRTQHIHPLFAFLFTVKQPRKLLQLAWQCMPLENGFI